MAYEEFRGELDKPTEYEEFSGKLDSPSTPPSKKEERGFIDTVTDFFKPAPKSVMEGYQPTPQERQAEVDRRLSYGAGPISSETAAKADLVRSGMAKPDNRVVQKTVEGMDRVKAPSFGDLVERAKQANEEITRQESGLNLSLVPDQFKSGVAGMQQGFFASVAKNNASLLNIMDRIDAGEKIVPADDPLGYQDMSPEQRAQIRAQIEGVLPKNVANVIAYGQEQQQYARNPAADQLVKQANEGNYAAAWKTFTSDPLGIIQQLSVQSAPNALPSLAGGAAGVLLRGGIGGMMAGLATGSFPVEYMASITESLQNSGVDLNDAKAVEAKLRDPKFLEDAGKRAVTRGTVIAAADAASGRLLMPLRAGQLGRNVARGGVNVLTETGLEMGGEAGAQTFSGEEVKLGDVIAEGLGAGPQAAGTTTIKTINETLTPARELNFTPADSPSAQAGLAPIVVPEPTSVPVDATQVNPATEQQFGLDQLRMRGGDVSTDSTVGTGPGDSGIDGGDQLGGSVGVPGLDVDSTVRPGSADAGGVAADAGTTVAAGSRAGELPSAVAAPDYNNAEPTEQWFGRKGDGYVTEGDAQQALPGRQRMFPNLEWTIEQMPSGKYRLAGYTQETTNVTQAAETQQAETQGQEIASSGRQSTAGLEQAQPAVPDAVLAEFARNPNAPDSRAGVQAYLDELVANGRLPSAPKLGTPDADAETTVSALGRIFGDATGTGNRVVAYADPGGDNGFALGGIAFVNTSLDETAIDAPKTVLHELRHVAEQLARSGSKPAQEFTAKLDSIFDDMTDDGKRAYVTNFLFKDTLDKITNPAEREAKVAEFMTSPTLRSEMVADFLGNRAQDREFMIDLARQDPKGFEGFVRRWLAVIDNLIAKLKGGKTQGSKESAKVDQYIRDLNKAKMVARDALIQFRKGNLGEQQVQVQTEQEAEPVMSRRGAEQVGEFEVRTMKDGSAVVYGDPEAIRAQIPDDVKGRVTKDGIVFTTSAAPRVKAALEGRKTAYSRAGAVLDKLPMKDGKYIGAPAKFNTPGKITTLRKILRQLADEGAPGRYWYENSGKEVLKMVGGDVEEARRFVALLAIYSPQAKVDANSTFALRAWAQYKAGQPISVKTGSQDRKATEAMQDVDAFWKGEKTGNFFFNLLREIDPSTQGKQGATIDMWMMRAGQYDNDAPTATQYAFMENETNRLAAELGWEPQQVQAAIWVAMKARMENPGVKKRTEASSEKKGWIRYDYPLKNGKPFKTRVILDAQKHRDNWLKYSFEHDVTKDDTQQAKFDFGDGLKRHIGQVSFEARPGRSTGVLPGIHSAPYAQQVEFQQAVQRAFYDEQGNDILAMKLGLLVDTSDILLPGVWQGEVSPSSQKLVAMAPAKGEEGKSNVDEDQAKLLNVYAAVAGLVAKQEGVGWHRPFYAGTKRDSNGIDIDLGRAIDPREAADLEQAVGKWMADNGKEGWQDSFALISSPTGIRLVNFGIITNEILHSEIVKVAEGVLPNFEYRLFASDGNMPSNNWKEFPNGQSYVQGISAAGRSDVLDWARTVLAPRVQQVFRDFSKRYDWGDAGEIQFSRRDTGPAEPAGRSGIERDRGDGSVKVQGAIHYATQKGLSALSGARFGTGIKGAEQARLAERGVDPRIKRRVYFYLPVEGGVAQPESGLGGYVYSADLSNMYDPATGDRDFPRTPNEFESAVLDAGFRGYISRGAGIAVVLNSDVPVKYLGTAAEQNVVGRRAVATPVVTRTRTDGEELVRRPSNEEMVGIIKARPALRDAARSFRLEFGEARVNASEAAAADIALAEAGADFRFSAEAVPALSRRQTETAEFKRWFGNSQVVDENGEPMVVYRGTTLDVSQFDAKTGIYFTNDPNGASIYAGQEPGSNIVAAYLSIKNPYVAKDYGDIGLFTEKKIERLKKEGFDGAVFTQTQDDGTPYTEYVAFDSSQVKSASGNTGEFDSENPDIRYSQRQRDSWFLGRDELGRINLGAGAKAYRYAADVANIVLDKLAMKPISKDLSRAMRKMKTEIAKARELTAGVATKLSELTEEERLQISDVIEGELKRGVKPVKRVLEVAASMQDIMSEQTAELVRLGMMSPDAANRWEGKYLPRFYESKLKNEGKEWLKAAKALLSRTKTMQGIKGSSLKGRGIFQTIPVEELEQWLAEGWEERDPDFDPNVDEEITVWRDYTRAEREDMGEIRDAMFRFVMGYTRTQQDIALGRLYENLANTVASKKEKPGYVRVDKTDVRDTNAKRYGKLAGMWVPKEVLDHLTAFDSSQQNELLKFYLKAMSKWKEGKTVLNPVSHANNVLSNVTMAHFAGVSYWDVEKYIGATRDLVKNSDMVKEAQDAGLFGGGMTQSDLIGMLPDQLKVMAAKTESKAGRIGEGVWNAMSFWLRKPLAKAYEAEDMFFRYLIYRDARNNGLNVDDAVDYAQKYIFTYDDLPKGARRVRDFALPFFAYTYKVVPTLAETALTKPWRYAAPAIALYTVNAAMYAIAAGGDDDDWMELIKRYVTDEEFREKAKAIEADERPNLPPWMKGASLTLGTSKAVRLGVDEVTGLPVFLDVSRIFPGGDLFDAHNNAGGIPLFAPITPNNPILTVASAMLYNKDTFRGTEVVKASDTDAEAAAKRAKWMYQQVAPAIAVGNSHFDRAMNVIANITGQPLDLGFAEYTGVDNQGMPVQPKYAAMQTVGIKARPIDLEASEKIQQAEQNKLIREIETEMRRTQRLEQRGAITTDQAEKLREKQIEKRQRLREGLTVDGEERE